MFPIGYSVVCKFSEKSKNMKETLIKSCKVEINCFGNLTLKFGEKTYLGTNYYFQICAHLKSKNIKQFHVNYRFNWRSSSISKLLTAGSALPSSHRRRSKKATLQGNRIAPPWSKPNSSSARPRSTLNAWWLR